VPVLALVRPVVDGAVQPLKVDGLERGLELRHQLALKFVHGLAVLADAEEARIAFVLLEIRHAENEHTTVGVGKGADGFQCLADHLAADPFEFAASGFVVFHRFTNRIGGC
jgi:hypothetical protein